MPRAWPNSLAEGLAEIFWDSSDIRPLDVFFDVTLGKENTENA